MKLTKSEIVFVSIWIVFLLLRSVDYDGSALFLFLAALSLSIYYLYASFKLLKTNTFENGIIPVITGIALGTSIITIQFHVFLRNADWINILPWINALFAVYLLYLILRSLIKKGVLNGPLIQVFSRSLIVLIVTGFFALHPFSSSAYRSIVIWLNAGHDDLISNIKMAGLAKETDKLLDLGACDAAIKTSLQSFREGLNWLEIEGDSLSEKDKRRLWQIQKTYNDIYRAYNCKADEFEEDKKYEEELKYRFLADSFLNINPEERFIGWRRTRADSKNDIAVCYKRLGELDSAAVYYMKAINYYRDSVGTTDRNLAIYLLNVGHLLDDWELYDRANAILDSSNRIFLLDTTNIKNVWDIGDNYLTMAWNDMSNDNLDLARIHLDDSRKYLNDKSYCKNRLYNALLNNRQHEYDSAIESATESKYCYLEQYGPTAQNIGEASSILFDAWLGKANYDSAINNLEKAKSITLNNYSSTTTRYHNVIRKEAMFYEIVGNYEKSKELYEKVGKNYTFHLGEKDRKMAMIHEGLASVNIELRDFKEANRNINLCIELGHEYESFDLVGSSDLMNSIAYTKYVVGEIKLADSIYNHVIELNRKKEMESSLPFGDALNGLALVESRRDKLFADSLFERSLEIHTNILGQTHPNTAIVQMNLGLHRMSSNELEDAESRLLQALDSFRKAHRSNHPTLSEIMVHLGSLYILKGDNVKAKGYLNEALLIALESFEEEHVRIKEINTQLAKLSS